MYQDFYNLKALPFENTPDPGFFFLGASYRSILAGLLHGVVSRKGMMCVAGPPGSGKTTLANVLKNHLPDNTLVVPILHPKATPDQLIDYLARTLDVEAQGFTMLDLHHRIKCSFESLEEQDQRCLLIMDEAQFMSEEMFHELLFLSNQETSQGKLLQILLLGQMELIDRIDQEQFRQLRQRMFVFRTLGPLNKAETMQYVAHRVEKAGGSQGLFLQESLDLIFKASGGSPREINKICDVSLLTAFLANENVVTPRDVRAAGQTLGMDLGREPVLPGQAEQKIVSPYRETESPPESFDHDVQASPPADITQRPGMHWRWLAVAAVLIVVALLTPGILRNFESQIPEASRVDLAIQALPAKPFPPISTDLVSPEIPASETVSQEPEATAVSGSSIPKANSMEVEPPEIESPGAKPRDEYQSTKPVEALQSAMAPPRPYCLMLATFFTMDKAAKGLAKYEAMGLSPYASRVVLKNKKVRYRVFSGHYASKREAEAMLTHAPKGAEVRNVPYAALLGSFASKEACYSKIDKLSDWFPPPYVVEEVDGAAKLYAGAFFTPEGVQAACEEFAHEGVSCEIAHR